MSARRRQEAIARFSVPIEDDHPVTIDSEPSRRTRRTSSTASLEGGAADVDDNDSDFVIGDMDNDEDDYLNDSDDDKPVKKTKKGKGKGKATNIRRPPVDEELELDTNPRVMLLSLKAVGLLWYIRMYHIKLTHD